MSNVKKCKKCTYVVRGRIRADKNIPLFTDDANPNQIVPVKFTYAYAVCKICGYTEQTESILPGAKTWEEWQEEVSAKK